MKAIFLGRCTLVCGFQSVFLPLISSRFLPILSISRGSFIVPLFFLEEADSMELNVSSMSQSQEMAELRRLPLGSWIMRLNSF